MLETGKLFNLHKIVVEITELLHDTWSSFSLPVSRSWHTVWYEKSMICIFSVFYVDLWKKADIAMVWFIHLCLH
jgi:hypothetical protein